MFALISPPGRPSLGNSIWQGGGSSWSVAGDLITARFRHTATLLTDGKVLVAGGADGNFAPSRKAEIYDPATRTWSAAADMNAARFAHSATLLNDGRVLVVGGVGLSSAEIFNPATGVWSAAASLNIPRDSHTATLLADGKVLIAGGNDSTGSPMDSAQLFDPAANSGQGSWAVTGILGAARASHIAVRLSNGRVLVAGGGGAGSSFLRSAELYDPATGAWSATGQMNTARFLHTGTLLANGRVLVTGGLNGTVTLQSAEIYNPAAGAWSGAGNLDTARYAHTATLLVNNQVLIAGGVSQTGSVLNIAELFDPAGAGGQGSFALTANLNVPREEHTATLLQNGQVLVAGGGGASSVLRSSELFNLVSTCPAITINPAAIPAGTVGAAYPATTFTQSGGTGAVTFNLSGALPAGMTFSNGALSGTPAQPGSFQITVTATDAVGCAGSRNYTLTINCQAITVNPATIPAGVVGANYNQTFTQTGGVGAVNFTLTGALPSGLVFLPSGSLTGVPTQTGSFPITVTATDSNNCAGSRNYTLVINCPAITVEPAELQIVGVNAPFSQTFTQTGGAAPVTFSLTGTLPPGVSFSSSGLLSGTPTQLGSFPITITATDARGCAGSRSYTLVVNPEPGIPFPSVSEGSDQKTGSVLFYNFYTSSPSSPAGQNTRISITNTNTAQPAFVRFFFVDGSDGSATDGALCLRPHQTMSFLVSDIDPGVTGYVVAVAIDGQTGCPVNFNYLIGDEYVKLSSGHATGLTAEAFAASGGGLPACNATSGTAVLHFDGAQFNAAPAMLALDSVFDRASQNDTLVVINRVGGNLGANAGAIGQLVGVLYDFDDGAKTANAYNFTADANACQFRASLSNNFPLTTPRFDQVIRPGVSGWLKFWEQSGNALLGAAINFNPNHRSSANAYTQGRNLRRLRLTTSATLTIPISPPAC